MFTVSKLTLQFFEREVLTELTGLLKIHTQRHTHIFLNGAEISSHSFNNLQLEFITLAVFLTYNAKFGNTYLKCTVTCLKYIELFGEKVL